MVQKHKVYYKHVLIREKEKNQVVVYVGKIQVSFPQINKCFYSCE